MPTPRPAPGIAVTVLAGLDRATTSLLTAGLLTRTDDCASVWVDPAPAGRGYVDCVLDDSTGRHERFRAELVGDCLSCTVRAAVVVALTRLRATGRCRSAVVELHPGADLGAAAEGLCAVLSPDVAVIDTVAAVVDPTRWFDDLVSDDDLVDRGLALGPDDHRPLSTVVAGHLDVADHLVFATAEQHPTHVDLTAATALQALAPTARRITPPTVLDVPTDFLLATGGHDPRCLNPLHDGGLLDWASPPPTGGGLSVVRWWRRGRPFHLGRFTAMLDDLGRDLVRGAGRVWFAHTPDVAIRWDSCGSALQLAAAGPRPAAVHRLALLGRDLDHDAVTGALTASLLTDEEMAASGA